MLGEIADAADLPPGVLNVVTGDVAASEHLTTHPGVDMVSFTGSDIVGKKIMSQAADGLKKTLLELGGKSPNIVFAGSDVDKFAMSRRVPGSRSTPGRGARCRRGSSPSAASTTRSSSASRRSSAKIKVGDPTDPKVMMGPLIREAQRERVERYVADRHRRGRAPRVRRGPARRPRPRASSSSRRCSPTSTTR